VISNQKTPLKRAVIVIIATVFLSLFAFITWKTTQNWRAIQLFAESRRVENFRQMNQVFPSQLIKRAGPVFQFQREPQALSETYTYNGKKLSLHEFFQRTQTTGFLVLKDDKIVDERYFQGSNDRSQFTSWSVAKSFISALVGIAIDEGLIQDVRDPVTNYVPELKNSGYGGYDGVPIQDILQMSSGIRFNEDYDDLFSDINQMFMQAFLFDKPINQYIRELKSERPPGTFRHYVSVDTQVLGMLLNKVTGKAPSQYLEEKIWKPLGMESDAFWNQDRTGTDLSYCCLNATLRDYAKFGRLFLHEGNWEGKQILSQKWIEESTTPNGPNMQPGKIPGSDETLGYQYQWWIPEQSNGEYMAIGVWGQYIYVYPKENLVIVKTSVDPNYIKPKYDDESIAVFRSIANHLRPH
jgi:CubicO group peptidase (beta-lactamase class C family)